MPRRIVTPVFALAASAALLLGATACAPEGARPGASASAGTSPSTSPTASGAPTATSAPSATPTPTATPGTVTGAACLPGTWTMGQAALTDFYTDINTVISGSGIGLTPRGSATLTVGTDGTYAWAPAIEVTAEAGGTAILVDLGGRADGIYRVEGDRVVSESVSTDGLTATATLDGAPTDASAVLPQITAVPLTDAAFTCAGDTLTLGSTIPGGAATAVLQRG